jgi:hypothetical protein
LLLSQYLFLSHKPAVAAAVKVAAQALVLELAVAPVARAAESVPARASAVTAPVQELALVRVPVALAAARVPEPA